MPDSLRLLTWNIRKALGTDRRRDPARILDLVAELAPDVVLLQEADYRRPPRRAALPRDLVAQAGFVPLPVDTPGLGWHGNAMLTATGVSVAEVHPLALRGLEARGALIADLETALGPLRIGSLHLGLTRWARRWQQRQIVAHLGTLPARPTVLGGDLNEWSRRRGLGALDRAFAISAPTATFHSRRPVLALDRVMTGPGLALTDLRCVDTAATRLASDHLPLLATIRRTTDG